MSMSPKWAQTAVASGLLIVFIGFVAFVINTVHDGRREKESVKLEQPAAKENDWVDIGGHTKKLIDKDNNVVCYKFSASAQISCVVGYGEAK